MQITTGELAKKLGAEIIGDAQLNLFRLAPIESASQGELTFLSNKKYFAYLDSTNASAIIAPPDVKDRETDAVLLIHPDPYYAYSQAVSIFFPDEGFYKPGIHDSAVMGDKCRIDPLAHIGANCVLEDEVEIGPGSTVLPGCFIGRRTKIGGGCLIYANVTIREDARLGDNVIIHSGTVIGSDGFGYAQKDGVHHKIPQVGKVVIEDDVEIGANVTIDRAALGETRIGKGTKIDNLVQIAHNVRMGERCIIVSQTGISGSTVLGNSVILAGQVGLIGHLKIGDNTIIAAQSGVKDDLEEGKMYLGTPAKEMRIQTKIEAALKKLPDLIKRVRALEKKLKEN